MSRVQVNPIIPGFAPDPSTIYVDGTYFLVNSTFHMFPGLPIYASKDLATWTHIGNAFNRKTQLSLRHSFTKLFGPEATDGNTPKMAAQGGLYAPSIRYHKGTFYIVCTNVLHKPELPYFENEFQNFILSTTDIWSNEWSDPVFYDFYGIDTSLFFDDDDKVYLIGSANPAPACTIRQFEIDLKTGAKLSEEKLLWEGITKVFPEGPHMYKKDGWYCLLIAEGGCFEDHHTIMARSRDIWGPFEVNPANPVMQKADPKGYIQFTGHADLVQDPESQQWYFICLGARKTSEGRFIMGRETVITTATWPEGDYPVIDPATLELPSSITPRPIPEWPVKQSSRSFTPSLDLLHIRDPDEKHYRYEGSNIILKPSKASIHQSEEPISFVGKHQRQLEGESSVSLSLPTTTVSTSSSLETGLCYYKDEFRNIRLFYSAQTRRIVLHVLNKARSIDRVSSREIETSSTSASALSIRLGISYTESGFTFFFAEGQNGQEKQVIGEIDTLEMTGYGFVGPVIGVFACVDENENEETEVTFRDFRVD
ncbi:glycosyl hydrolase [Aspergillus karnatakaensis]|uniref:glycoside hydrolase family 43 protein n=1 Tax=Aspergillus karnatakaensis TaxID=1810916 RepID=UPI003CCD56B6